MKTMFLGLAVAMAMPFAAHAAEPEHQGKECSCCCCCKGEHGKMACCDGMTADKAGEGDKDPHSGHDMPKMDPK